MKLENSKIYKASFKSVIGTIYYLWIESNKVKEVSKKGTGNESAGNKVGAQNELSYLGNRDDLFEEYIENLKKKLYREGKFSLQEKKSAEIENHILDYLSGKVKKIKLDTYFLFGTDFEKKVWRTAVSIHYGKTMSYRELAEKAGFPLAWRAAGTALGRNPVMLVVPCHRIIKSDGSIGNFGSGAKIKEFLLNLEASNKY